MAPRKATKTRASDIRAFEAQLWEACEAQRGSVNASRYKHPVLGLVFLKYVNDNFEQYRLELSRRLADPHDEYYLEHETDRLDVLEDRDEYLARNVFWIPPDARWTEVRDNAAQPDIDTRVDKIMDAIERENPSLRGVLPKSFAASEIPTRNLNALIGIVDGIAFGDDKHDGRDKLGQVYEYFLGKFSGIEGRAGEDYTPRSVVDLLVEMVEPLKGRIYDPCCGSGGMFVQSRRFLAAHGGSSNDLAVYGQESNPETWRLCKMNLALHGIDGSLGDRADSSFTSDLHPDLRADFIITNPPFNLGERGRTGWGRSQLLEDARWRVAELELLPPDSNANFAWILHFLHHLAPGGYAAFVIANGALSNTNRAEEVAIRRKLVDAGYVDCVVALPGKLFANTPIPVSLCILAKNRERHTSLRSRKNEILFINAAGLGHYMSRTQLALSPQDISKIAATYHGFRTVETLEAHYHEDGFSRVADSAEVASQDFILSPSRYVGSAELDVESGTPRERISATAAMIAAEADTTINFLQGLKSIVQVLPDADAWPDVARVLGDARSTPNRSLLLIDRLLTGLYEQYADAAATDVPLGDLFEPALGGVWGNDDQTRDDEQLVACLRGIDLANLADGRLPTPPLRWISTAQTDKRAFGDGELWLEGSGSFCGRSMLITQDLQRLFAVPARYSNFVKRLVPRIDYRHSFPAWLALRAAFDAGEMANYRTGSAFPNLDLSGLLKNFKVALLQDEHLERLWDFVVIRLSPEFVRASVISED